jgi:hypothetical protein
MLDAAHAGWSQPLNEPLPPEVAGSGHGPLTHYRIYPVFGPAWKRGRLRVWLAIALGLLLVVTLAALAGEPDLPPLGGLVQAAVQLLLPTWAGPWLCAWVRRQGWAPPREWWALVAVISLLSLAMPALHLVAGEALKQRVAELTGAVDETGKRKRLIMAFGLSVTRPEDAAHGAEGMSGPPKRMAQETPWSNAASSAFITFWLAGGAGLWGWRRERAGLAALAQRRELARAQAQRREAELRLSVLAAQVEPHFLFNTLAGVRSAISTDPPRASEMIDHLVDYLRAAIPRLRSDGGAQATLGSQLDTVRAYLGLMAARMPRLQFRIDVPTDLLGAACPPLMLISLAENAVRHGVEPKIGPALVVVSAQRAADGALHITVADDGAGFGNSTSGTGLGLANIRERLQQMYAGRAALQLKARPEGGVAATLTLPPE